MGRSVIVPANGSLPNIILSPRSVWRRTAFLERERFDLVHIHEPMTPTPPRGRDHGAGAVSDRCTLHASGELAWLKLAKPCWGFLLDRIDHRIAVSEPARESAGRYFPGEYELIPNGVLVPDDADPSGREEHIVFIGRQEPRKGLQILLRAWHDVRRRTGARLRLIGADPLAVRLLLTRLRVSGEGIDVLGFLSQEDLTAELLAAKALVAPSLGGESFGMVLTRAFACATPVVASDIRGYRASWSRRPACSCPRASRLPSRMAIAALLADEPRREGARSSGPYDRAGAVLVGRIGERLADIYETLAGSRKAVAA